MRCFECEQNERTQRDREAIERCLPVYFFNLDLYVRVASSEHGNASVIQLVLLAILGLSGEREQVG
jgi:hypothetical protein